jgi:hypothetical protein
VAGKIVSNSTSASSGGTISAEGAKYSGTAQE